jgi:hypothetical protein
LKGLADLLAPTGSLEARLDAIAVDDEQCRRGSDLQPLDQIRPLLHLDPRYSKRVMVATPLQDLRQKAFDSARVSISRRIEEEKPGPVGALVTRHP